MHQERCACISDCLCQGEVGPPIFDGVTLDLHRLSVDIRQLHQLALLHLHIEVDSWSHLREVVRQDDLQRMPTGCYSLENQVVLHGLVWEVYGESTQLGQKHLLILSAPAWN